MFWFRLGCVKERNSKHQTPSSREVPKLKPQKQMPGQTARSSVLSLELDAALELGVWNLELFAWPAQDGGCGGGSLTMPQKLPS